MCCVFVCVVSLSTVFCLMVSLCGVFFVTYVSCLVLGFAVGFLVFGVGLVLLISVFFH